MSQLELAFTSGWCQRWDQRRHSWRHRSEGGFDPGRYLVQAIADPVAKAYVERHHYSASYPAARLRFGLFDRELAELVGVAVLSVPAQAKVLTCAFPHLEPYSESLELGRLVLADSVPANAETWMLAQTFRLAADCGVRGVVSFSDPMPRTAADGRIVMPGHVGIIYQASNATYTGRGTARTLTLLPDGTVLSPRSMQKVRSGERGVEYVERQLVALGAPEMAGDRTRWMRHALEVIGARSLRHPGNHRFIFKLGRDRREQRQVLCPLPALPYPKRADAPVPA
jgi:hypothetical protein